MTDCWLVHGTGAYGKPGLKITTGGTVGATTVCVGAHHIASGLFDKALCIGFEKQEEGDTGAILSGVAHPLWGRSLAGAAVGYFATMGSSYMATWGATEEHSAMVAVKARQNARKTYAHLSSTSPSDALNSRMLSIRSGCSTCAPPRTAPVPWCWPTKTAKKRCKTRLDRAWIRPQRQFELDWRFVDTKRPIFSNVRRPHVQETGCRSRPSISTSSRSTNPRPGRSWSGTNLGLWPRRGIRLVRRGDEHRRSHSGESVRRGSVHELHRGVGHAPGLGGGPADPRGRRRASGAEGRSPRPDDGLRRHELDGHDGPVEDPG